MNANHYRELFDYNVWANRRVWTCVETLTDEQFYRPCDYSIGSVHDQLVHQMAVERLYLMRVTGEPVTGLPASSEYPDRDSSRAEWDDIEQAWRQYLPTLTDEMLEARLEFLSITTKTPQSCLRWQALSQAINHSTDHRAQILSLIHQVGGEKTVPQDFLYYVWKLE